MNDPRNQFEILRLLRIQDYEMFANSCTNQQTNEKIKTNFLENIIRDRIPKDVLDKREEKKNKEEQKKMGAKDKKSPNKLKKEGTKDKEREQRSRKNTPIKMEVDSINHKKRGRNEIEERSQKDNDYKSNKNMKLENGTTNGYSHNHKHKTDENTTVTPGGDKDEPPIKKRRVVQESGIVLFCIFFFFVFYIGISNRYMCNDKTKETTVEIRVTICHHRHGRLF